MQTVLRLKEYEKKRFARDQFTPETGEWLWRHFGKRVEVEFPSLPLDNQWQLTSKGWVGFIPVSREVGLLLEPKVVLANLFGMLEVAYQLKEFEFLKGLITCGDLDGYFDQMAAVLAKRTLDRGRKGYYRAYLERQDDLPYVRGRIDMAAMMRAPWRVQVNCEYQEHTGDVVDNQILVWTLWCLSRGGLCSDETLRYIRKAYRDLAGIATTTPRLSDECVDRLYNRLNQDYEPLHALCRFFLEHQTIPAVELEGRRVLPFLVDMARLFELFVAKWLQAHSPVEWEVREQQQVVLDAQQGLQFRIDLVLQDAATRTALAVLDTKYKDPESISTDDVQQVVAYAVAWDAKDAVLIYPAPPPLTCAQVGDVTVHFLAFDLAGDLDEAGQALLDALEGIVAR